MKVFVLTINILLLKCTLSVAQNNSLKWVNTIFTHSFDFYDIQARYLASDTIGNIFVCVDNRPFGPIDGDTLFYQFDSTGATIKSYTVEAYGGGQFSSGNISSAKVTTDNLGNLFISGFYGLYVDLAVGPDTFILDYSNSAVNYIVKYNSLGIPQWQLSKNFITTFNYVYDIQTDYDGNLYVTGNFRGTRDFDPGLGTYEISATASTGDVFLLKLNSNGEFQWVTYLNSKEGSKGRNIAIDSDGNINLCGEYWGDANIYNSGNNLAGTLPGRGGLDAFILKFSPNGTLLNKLDFGSFQTETFNCVVADKSGNIYVAGRFFSDNVSSNVGNFVFETSLNIVFAKINALFEISWLKNIGNVFNGYPYGITYIQPTNSIVFVGTMASPLPVDFDPSPSNVFNLKPIGFDGFVGHYKADDGALNCAFLIGGNSYDNFPTNDFAYSVVSLEGSHFAVYGEYTGSTDFEPGNGSYILTKPFNATSAYAYLAKYDASSCQAGTSTQILPSLNQFLNIFPNPVKDVLNIESSTGIKQIDLSDITGRIIKTQIINDTSGQISLKSFKPGIYICTIHTISNEVVSKKFIVAEY